jgi:hypothetical protein
MTATCLSCEHGRDRDGRTCYECDGRGTHDCCYCGDLAEAGQVQVTESGLTEWQCTDCHEYLDTGRRRVAKLEKARADYEGACDARGDAMRDERGAA